MENDFHEKFYDIINTLRKIAMCSDINYKHAAALIKTSEQTIFGVGYNRFTAKMRTVHAELNALFNNKLKSVKGMDIIVIRTSKNKLANSRPCNNCIEKMIKMGIRKVYYSNESGKIVSEFVEEMDKIHISSGTKYQKDLKEIKQECV